MNDNCLTYTQTDQGVYWVNTCTGRHGSEEGITPTNPHSFYPTYILPLLITATIVYWLHIKHNQSKHPTHQQWSDKNR